MSHSAEIISVGTELLLGNITNTDARDISIMLSELGINVFYHTVVGDNPQRLKDVVAIAKKRADILITTGGLGPTCDDLTKQTLAEAFGLKLVYDEQEAEIMRRYFQTRLHTNRPITQNNYQQVYLPEGCTVFHNTCGTAPGCAFEAQGVHVLMLPGPPRECMTMFRLSAMPYLQKLSGDEIISHNLHIFGMGESSVEDKLRGRMLALQNPTLAPYAKDGEVRLRVTAKASSTAEAETLCQPVIDEVCGIFGSLIYGIDTDSLENTAFGLLKKAGKTLAAAESCTGGLLAKRITDIPGASGIFLGSAVTYASSAKSALIGVDAQTLSSCGAVSKEVAQQMATGARKAFGSSIGIGITGLVGPEGDGSETPVGTVYIAMDAEGTLFCRCVHLGTDRQRGRTMAVHHAFDMIRRYLTGLDI